MASSTSSDKALRITSLPGPPPTPTSLLDLPQPWLLQLLTCSALDRSSELVALFRTCTFFRDGVLRHHTAEACFHPPEEHLPRAVERLCAVARRSNRVRLCFFGRDEGPLRTWERTEPCITHLRVCAMAELGSSQSLTCVKEVVFFDLEQTSLVPAWIKVLCPNVTKLELRECAISPQPLHQPMPHQHLQQLLWDQEALAPQAPTLGQHVRQQLAALPSLTSLTLPNLPWVAQEEGEQQAGRLISSSVTRLEVARWQRSPPLVGSVHLRRLPAQFPNLRELQAPCCVVDDEGLGLLRQFAAHQPRLTVGAFYLGVSHAHEPWPWPEVAVRELDVASFARLPLDRIQACRSPDLVRPSADATAVARVAQAVRRWGGFASFDDESGGLCEFLWGNLPALAATLGPLVTAAQSEGPDRNQSLTITGMRDVIPQQLRQLGQHLPPCVTTLCLDEYALSPHAWAALLPSLPATVEELDLGYTEPFIPEAQVLALCWSAVRPIRVRVPQRSARMFRLGLTEEQVERIRAALAGGGAHGAGMVTLNAFGF